MKHRSFILLAWTLSLFLGLTIFKLALETNTHPNKYMTTGHVHAIQIENSDPMVDIRLSMAQTYTVHLPLVVSPLPVGTGILFSSDQDGNWDIFTINPDGSGQTNLTNTPTNDFNASWSPDGTQIAFDSFQDGGGLDIFVMNADGSGLHRITPNSSSYYSTGPDWSPDGKLIAFSTSEFGEDAPATMKPDGSQRTILFPTTTSHTQLDWSPDGSKLALTKWVGFDNTQIYIINADGSNAIQLTNHAQFNSSPAWSPDGSKIAFASNYSGNWEIYVMNANGSGQVNITQNSSEDRTPVWSPDGTKIAFSTNRDGDFEIFIVNNDGSSQTQLTDNNANDYVSDWSPVSQP